MKRFVLGCAILPAVLLCSNLAAQDPEKLPQPSDQAQSPNQVQQTEDMWFYMQELRRHDDPLMAIRRKEELKARQRRGRIAAMKWYGYSQSRPSANPMPFTGYHSPMWAGNGCDPYLWIGNAYVTTALQIEVPDGTTVIRR